VDFGETCGLAVGDYKGCVSVSLVLVERPFSCFDLDGRCGFSVVYGMCCRRLGVYSGASGTVVNIRLG
jgi:hypothetical protein